jgi:hypothetical protein
MAVSPEADENGSVRLRSSRRLRRVRRSLVKASRSSRRGLVALSRAAAQVADVSDAECTVSKPKVGMPVAPRHRHVRITADLGCSPLCCGQPTRSRN